MIPRDYQRAAVDAARAKTREHGNTMLVLPTGAGKTAIAGFYIGEEVEDTRDARILVLQHTDELIEQNRGAVAKVTGLATSVVKAEQDDWDGRVVFGSVQTLARANRRARMSGVSHLVIDECHRAAAASYQSIIEHVRGLNPAVKLLGLSATPGRGDGRSLRKTFTNVGYQLKIGTLIARGLLVPPRTFTIDLGVEDELAGLSSTAGDFDMREADKVLNRAILNEAVVEHWKERAADRRSIFFCATVDHAEAVAAAFRTEGITAETVTGEMPGRARADLIARFDRGEVQVLTNCMVLTEGFDSQPVGCIGILRPMLHKGTFIQAIGRGLRRVDPERLPGIVKTDCVVLDFAGAALRHGSLEQEISLDDEDHEPGAAPWKTCPSCEAELPLGASVCDFCGHVFARDRGETARSRHSGSHCRRSFTNSFPARFSVRTIGSARSAWVLDKRGGAAVAGGGTDLPQQGADLMPRTAVCVDIVQNTGPEYRVDTPTRASAWGFTIKSAKEMAAERFPGHVAPRFIYRMAQSENLLPFVLGAHRAPMALPALRAAGGTWSILDESEIRRKGFTQRGAGTGMLIVQNASEPASLRNALVDIVTAGAVDIRVASAYVTLGGANILLSAVANAVGPAAFAAMPKTLVTSFDFGLTEPQALQHWRALANATVFVSGAQRLAQGSLMPQRAFHPKLYFFGCDPLTCSTLVGSANLTSRGFSVNTEAAWVQQGVPRAAADAAFDKARFETTALTDELLAAYAALRQAQPPPPEIEQEAQPVAPPAAVVGAALPLFRLAIETGAINPADYAAMWVHGEALQGGSSNQLELPRGGHRFFGFVFDEYDYPHNLTIGQPVLRSGARVWDDRRLTWHGNNGMERMNLPTATQGGFDYADTAVMFRRLTDGSFELIVTPWESDLARSWREASALRNLLFRLGTVATSRVVGLI